MADPRGVSRTGKTGNLYGQDSKYGQINHRDVEALNRRNQIRATAHVGKAAVTGLLTATGAIVGPIGAAIGYGAGKAFGAVRVDPVVDMYEELQRQRRANKQQVYPGTSRSQKAGGGRVKKKRKTRK